MSLPAGEARQSHIILQIRTTNWSEFEIIDLHADEKFQYSATVEGYARTLAAKVQVSGSPIELNRALLGLMNHCQEIIADRVSEETVLDSLHGLQVAYEAVQARLIASVRHASIVTYLQKSQDLTTRSGGRPKWDETPDEARERRRRNAQEANQTSSTEGKSA